MRTCLVSLGALVLLAPWTLAEEDARNTEELERRNAELERRVHELERTALAEEVEEYLSQSEAGGDNPLVPGGLSIRFSGEVRTRQELRDALYSPTDPAGATSFEFAHMRTRLRTDVDVIENVSVVIEIQDIRNFGQEGSTTGNIAGLDLKRGEIMFKEVFGRSIDVELGRFVMFYGDQRLIGHLEWFDQGRSYDGLRTMFRPEGWWVDFFAIRVRETVTPDDDQWLVGLYGGREWLEVYALLLGDDMPMAGETGVDDTTFVTLGFRIARKTGQWDYSTEVAFQVGDLRGDDLTAFAFAVVIGYTFEDTTWTPRVAIEVDYASGDENPTDGDSEQFQTLYPTNHLHYGYADLVGWSNIFDLHVKVTLKPRDTLTVTFGYHHFERPEETGAWINAGGAVVRSGLAGADDHLGDEVDITVMWKPSNPVSILVGYSIFVPGGFVEDTGDDPTAHFGYVQVRVKF